MKIISGLPITRRRANFLVRATFGLNIQQTNGLNCVLLETMRSMDFFCTIRLNKGRSVHILCGKLMKKLVFAILLIASPAWAQTNLSPKSVTARADPCAPIGRTADGKLVYSMKCDNLPAPPSPPQAESAPAPEPEVQRSGIFGLSYERKRPGE
jgi:hypothetical protein